MDRHPRAADDFPVIRARMEELRRERAAAHTETPPAGSGRLRQATGNREPVPSPGLELPIRRRLFGA